MSLDITKHMMVPVHILVDEDEEKKILEKYKISKEQLPKIKKGDPCVLALEKEIGEEILPGRIIKVIRNSPTAGIAVAYRVVIE